MKPARSEIGGFLPAEPELQKLFNVSRTTLRKAVELLAQDGFVSIRQGKGTAVLDFKATQRLQYVTSFSQTLRDKGSTVCSREITVDVVVPPGNRAENFRVSPEEDVVRIQRVTMANDKPIALMTIYLLPEMVPDIGKRIQGMSSLYAFLEAEYNLTVEGAVDFISATSGNDVEAEKLRIPLGSPLLVVRRISHARGRPIEVALLLVVAEKYEYCVYTTDGLPRTHTA